MKKKSFILLGLISSNLAFGLSSPSNGLRVDDRGITGLSLSYSIADDGSGLPDVFNAGNLITSDVDGLPVVTGWLAIPAGQSASCEVKTRRAELVQGEANHAAGDVRRLNDAELEAITPSLGSPVLIGRPVVFRGQMIAPVSILPVQRMNGGEMLLNSELAVDIVFTPDPSAPTPARVNDRPGSLPQQWLDRILLNPPRRDQEEQVDHIGHMLILYQDDIHEQAVAQIEKLADWKRQIGFKVSLEAVSADMQANQIRDMIRNDYYLDSPDPVTHLLLVGADALGAAIHFLKESSYGDNYFTLMDSDDIWASDLAVGRLYVLSIGELEGVVKRSILYEREPYMDDTDWFTHAVYTAENIGVEGGQFVPSMVQLGRWIYTRLIRYGYHPVDTLYAATLAQKAVVNDRVRELLENGVSIILSRGWIEGCMIDGVPTETGRRNPFLLAITCLSADDGGQQKYFRSATRNNQRGPIASLVMDGLTHTKSNNAILGWATRGITYNNLTEVGAIQNLTKYMMFSDLQYDDNALAEEITPTLGAYQLLGDPSVNIYTRVPIELSVEHPDYLTPGTTGLEVYVESDEATVPDARVCVWQPGGVQAVTSPGIDGWARVTFEPDQFAAGDTLVLTVMRVNAVPFIVTIPVEDADVQIALDAVDVNNGGDGRLANGESAPVSVTLRNTGESDADEVLVTLATEDSFVSFDDDTIQIGDIASGATAEFDFHLNLARSGSYGRTVRVGLNVHSGEELWSHSFQIETSGPDLAVQHFADDDEGFNPGTTVNITPYLQNIGDSTSTVVTARLVSLDTRWATVTNGIVTYSAIAPGGSASPRQGAHFRVSIDSLAIPGNAAHFQLLLAAEANGDDFKDTLSFEKPIGQPATTDPFGPDDYGYVAFDSYDVGWKKSPQYDWIEINPDRREVEFEGTQLDIGDNWLDQDATAFIDLPITFRYYGRDFDTLIVCSNGFVAFGAENSMFPDFRNWRIPGIQGPDAQVCVYWDDLFNPNPEFNGVYYYYGADRGIVIVEWSGMEIWQSENPTPPSPLVDAQVILFDPALHPTSTGDGEILFQYQRADIDEGDSHDNFYFTTGLKNLDNTGGLEYAYWNHYPAQCHPIEPGLAILFTVDLVPVFGGVSGRVLRFEDHNQPLSGVTVRAQRNPDINNTITDAEGRFRLDDVQAGREVLELSKAGFNTSQISVDIIPDSTKEIADAFMTHPEIALDSATVRTNCQPDTDAQAHFSIFNRGNGTLEYKMSRRYEDGRATEYAPTFNLRISELVSDSAIFGCEFVGESLYVAGGGYLDRDDDNMIYVFDKQGQEVRRFNQPTHGNRGFRDLAWDGQYLYGGESQDTMVTVFNTNGELIRHIRIPVSETELPDAFALTFNPRTRHLFIGNGYNDVFEMDLDGNLIGSITLNMPNELVQVKGLAWNPVDDDGMPLYIMDWKFNDQARAMRLVKADIGSGETAVVADLSPGRRGNGLSLAISFDWDSGYAALAAVEADSSNKLDRVHVYEIGPNSRFLHFEPTSGEIAVNSHQWVYMLFNADGLKAGDYTVGLRIDHNADGAAELLPVTLWVNPHSGVDEWSATPNAFELSPVYPNPFNSATRIKFTLDGDGLTRLALYDLQGREVVRLVDGEMTAGRHNIAFNGKKLASGIYFVRLHSGAKTAIRRMVIVR